MNSAQRRQAEEARAEVEFRMQVEGVPLAYEVAVAMLKDPKTPATARGQALRTILTLGGFDGKRQEPLSDSPIEWSPTQLQRELDLFMRERQQGREEEPDDGQDVFG